MSEALYGTHRIETGDCLSKLAGLPAGHVHCCVTSPPYWGLRSYAASAEFETERAAEDWAERTAAEWGEQYGGDSGRYEPRPALCDPKSGRWSGNVAGLQRWGDGSWGEFGLEPTPELYVRHAVEIFREVRRVLRDDATLWLNMGDRYAGSWGAQSRGGPPSGSSTLEGNGHVGGGPKIKSLSRVQIAQHPKTTHTGSLSRTPGLKPKDLVGLPWRLAFALQAEGWYLRSAMPWVKRSPMPDSCTDRPGSALEYVFMLTPSARCHFDLDAVRRAPSGISGGLYFGGPMKAGKAGKCESSLRTQVRKATKEARERYASNGRQWRNADLFFESVTQPHGMIVAGDELVGLDVTPVGFKEAHFATFPLGIPTPCIKAGTSERGCCPECGAGWVRVVDRQYANPGNRKTNGPRSAAHKQLDYGTAGYSQRLEVVSTTTGWRPGCECEGRLCEHCGGIGDCDFCYGVGHLGKDSVPCRVLDPFAGAGTTLLAAALLGRDSLGIELSPAYAAMAEKRIAKALRPASFRDDAKVADAPLFAGAAT